MARNKHPEVTKKRILDTATRLFLEKGWEETTIQDIMNELGDITRGAFYHHFKSKFDIIDEVTTQMFAIEEMVNEVSEEKQLNTLEKLKKMMISTMGNEKQHQFISTAKSVIQSPIFIGKQVIDCFQVIAPVIRYFIEEGVKDGSIQVEDPKQTSESFILLTNLWFNPSLFEASKEEYMLRIKHIKKLYESIGFPIIDDAIETTILKLYDSMYEKESV